jgi:hypothetical protein
MRPLANEFFIEQEGGIWMQRAKIRCALLEATQAGNFVFGWIQLSKRRSEFKKNRGGVSYFSPMQYRFSPPRA